jgi:hypothetical protein
MQHADSREVTGYYDARHLPLIDLVEVIQSLDLGFFQALAGGFLLSNQYPWPEEINLPEPACGSPNRFLLEESNALDINPVHVEKVLPEELVSTLFAGEILPPISERRRADRHLVQ